MELKSPKEMVANVLSATDRNTKEAFKIKSTSTINGALYGGAFGLLFSYYKNKNRYMGALVGVLVGGLVSNLLTVRKKEI